MTNCFLTERRVSLLLKYRKVVQKHTEGVTVMSLCYSDYAGKITFVH